MPKPAPALAILALTLGLAACGDGQPFPTDGAGDPDDNENPDQIENLLPGTEEPRANAPIVRYEDDEADDGGGFVLPGGVRYDDDDDRFYVDNLAFDGNNIYTRGADVRSLGGYRVFDGPATARDPISGEIINQAVYRAIYGESVNTGEDGEPLTTFAIVRTGSFVNFGFGGFLFERNGTVDLPASGQAVFTGDYAGMRVFSESGGLEFTRGDVRIAVDFEDYNDGNGVAGFISNREILDLEGNVIGSNPDLIFAIGPGASSTAGEATNELFSYQSTGNGAQTVFESGRYWAIMGGEDASELVGVFVVTAPDDQRGTVQETGGFIVYRGD
jgi:hypothetical protein